MRFLVTADLHIQKADRLPLLERILRTAEEQVCDALLIGGDLLDSPFPEAEAEKGILSLFAQWSKPIFLVAGNHDPLALTALYGRMPANVTVFPETLTAYTLGQNLRLYGYSALREQSDRHPLAGFSVPRGETALLLGHGHFEGTDFQPVRPEELVQSGVSLAVLGHIHKGEQRQIGGCRLLIPGIPQGRGWDETGEKFVYRVDADEKGIAVEPLSVAEVQYRQEEAELTGCTSAEEMLTRMERHLPKANTVVRLVLTGEVAEEADIAARLFTEKYDIEVIDRTTPALSAEAMQQQNTLQGHFVRRAIKEIANAAPQERPILEEALRLGLKALKEARL